MKNPLGYGYEKIDNFLLRGAEELVNNWTYATGRTKSDLANLLSLSGSMSLTASCLMCSPIFGAMILPLATIGAYLSSKVRKKIDKLERVQKNKQTLDKRIEVHKQLEESMGIQGLVATAFNLSLIPASPEFQEIPEISAMGTGLWTLSNYVMRTDSSTPKKSILEKAKDKLIYLINSYRPAKAYSNT